jgi:hypothetical protein
MALRICAFHVCSRFRSAAIGLALLGGALSAPAAHAEPAWSASAANRCFARTLLTGPLGATLSLDGKAKLLADVAKTILERMAPVAARANDVDLLGLRAVEPLSTEQTQAQGAARAAGRFVAAASLELAAAAPRGTVPDDAFAALAEAAAQTDQPAVAIRAVEQITDPVRRSITAEAVVAILAAAGRAAEAEQLFATMARWESSPLLMGRVANLLALGRSEDALAAAQAEATPEIRARDIREVAWFHLSAGDTAAGRRVLGLMRDTLQQVDGGFPAAGLGELAAGYALLGDQAARDEMLAIAARTDPAKAQGAQLEAAMALAARADERGDAVVARRATDLALELIAAMKRAGDLPVELIESEATRDLVERVGVRDGAAAATRLVELLGPRHLPALLVILARNDDVAGALRLAPDPGYERLTAIQVAAMSRLERGDDAGARALLGMIDDSERWELMRKLPRALGRTGKLEPLQALFGAAGNPGQTFDAQEAWAVGALQAGHVDAVLAMIARLEPREMGDAVLRDILETDDPQITPAVKDRLFAAQLATLGHGAARAAALIARARHRALQGDRAGAHDDLVEASAELPDIADQDTLFVQLIALAGVHVQLGDALDVSFALDLARELARTLPRGRIDPFMTPPEVSEEAIVMGRLLRLALLQARAGNAKAARAEIAPILAHHAAAPSADRVFLGPGLLQVLTVAGPLDEALGFRRELAAFDNPLAPIDALLRQAFKDADATGVDAALAYLAARLATASEAQRAPIAVELLFAMASLERPGPGFDALCPIAPEKSVVDLATGEATEAAADAVRACVAAPTPACVVALALPPPNAQEIEAPVVTLGEALVLLTQRGDALVAAAALPVLADILDARGRVPPRPASAAAAAAPAAIAPLPGLDPDLADVLRQSESPKPGERDHDERRYQLVRVLSALDQPSRALAIVPSIANLVVRVQAVMRVASALQRAGETEPARDLLWLAREMNGSTPSKLWGHLAIVHAEIGDMPGALRLAQQGARQDMGRFNPQQLVDPMVGIVVARVRAGDAARALDRLAVITDARWRDLAAARVGIRLAAFGKDDDALAAARRVANADTRRQSLALIAAAQLRGGRPSAAVKAAADAGDFALLARAKALELARQVGAQRRPVPAALSGLGEPALRAEAFAVLADALVAAKRPAEARVAAETAAAAAREAPPSPIVAAALANTAQRLAAVDAGAARTLLAEAFARTADLQATDGTDFWEARLEPLVALLRATETIAHAR